MTTADVLELVAELVVEEAVAVVSVVWPEEPVAVEPEAVVVAVELLVLLVTVDEVLEAGYVVAVSLGLLIVVAVVSVVLSVELVLSLVVEPLELPSEALIWNGKEYWKVSSFESKLILIPYVA